MNEAYLRIIDKHGHQGISEKIEIQAILKETTLSHEVNYFPSPVDEEFKDELEWYYREFLVNGCKDQRMRADKTVKKLIRLGREMGEQLFADDYVLYVILEKLDEYKLENVVVTIESDRPGFFNEPWELLVLPDSNRYLSTSVSAFIRTLPQELPERKCLALSTEKPLNVLIVAPTPTGAGDECLQSTFSLFYMGLLQHEHVINLEVLQLPTWSNFLNKITEGKSKYHLIHFEGFGKLAAAKQDGSFTLHLMFENESAKESLISIEEISKKLTEAEIEGLVLDLKPAESGQQQNFSKELEKSSAMFLNGGPNNLVISNYASYPFSKARYFQIFYNQILAGNSLGKAVVETRKVMQLNTPQNILSAQAKDLHDWPIAIHFGNRELELIEGDNLALQPTEPKLIPEINKNVVGFHQEYLSLAEFWGRDAELTRVVRAFKKQKIALLIGEAGIGKTHLVHNVAYKLVAQARRKTAFYFDYRKGAYSKESILQMIGHHLNGENADAGETKKIMIKEEFLLVFDNYSLVGNHNVIAKPLDEGEKQELDEFIGEISQGNSRIIVLDSNAQTARALPNIEVIPVSGLSNYDRRALAAHILRQAKIEDKEDQPGYDGLLDSLRGHPYLMQRVLPQLEEKTANDLMSEITDLQANGNENTLPAWFEKSWKLIPENWKPVLAALSGMKLFITDAFSIAAEMEDKTYRSPGRQLCDQLNVPKVAKISEILDAAAKTGFYLPKPSYKEVHHLTPAFLKKKKELFRWSEKAREKIDLILGKIRCLELKVLDPFLAQQSSPVLYGLVVENYFRWLADLEVLLDHNEYYAFLEGKNHLSNILNRAGLKKLVESWCLQLMKKHDFLHVDPAFSEEHAIVWLRIASSAALCEDVKGEAVLIKTIAFWEAQLRSDQSLSEVIFKNALMFLETCYRTEGNWEARRNLSSLSLSYYEHKEDYTQIVTSLQSLARCEEALGNLDETIALEQRLLEDIPHELLQEETKNKILIDIIQSRTNREEFDSASKLLAKLESNLDDNELTIVATFLKGDLAYKKQEFETAATLFSELWEGIIKKEHLVNPELVLKKLVELEVKLGKEKFLTIYRAAVPDFPLPSEVAGQRR